MKRAALTAMLLLAAPQARAYLLLEGPMPSLSGNKVVSTAAAAPTGFTPAPRFDLDARAPVQRGPNGPVIGPDLINRNINRGAVGSGFVDGASYSDDLARRSRTMTAIGTTLAPAITIRTPLK